jgi:hypothetical protein
VAEQSPEFDKYSMLDGAWHCDCGADGVAMQYVNYDIHAIATHTDGYSLLRAANGLIKEGPPRLPG